MLNGCLFSSNSSKVMPKDQISKDLPSTSFSFYVPIINYGAAYPFVPINLLLILIVPYGGSTCMYLLVPLRC